MDPYGAGPNGFTPAQLDVLRCQIVVYKQLRAAPDQPIPPQTLAGSIPPPLTRVGQGPTPVEKVEGGPAAHALQPAAPQATDAAGRGVKPQVAVSVGARDEPGSAPTSSPRREGGVKVDEAPLVYKVPQAGPLYELAAAHDPTPASSKHGPSLPTLPYALNILPLLQSEFARLVTQRQREAAAQAAATLASPDAAPGFAWRSPALPRGQAALQARRLALLPRQHALRAAVEAAQAEIAAMPPAKHRALVRSHRALRIETARRELAQRADAAARRARDAKALKGEVLGERGGALRDALSMRNKGLLRAHERLARERNKLKGDDRQLRLEALKAHDFEAYQEMLRAQSTGAASAGEKYVAISKFLKDTEEYLIRLASKIAGVKLSAEVSKATADAIVKARAQGLSEEDVQAAAHAAAQDAASNSAVLRAAGGGGGPSDAQSHYYELAHSNREAIAEQPSLLRPPGDAKLREYQLVGLQWMVSLYNNHLNGILADEMGLGKTLQTISLLGYLREFRGITGPHMVIVPKSTLHNWLNEFRRWCPAIKAVKFHGNQEQRAAQKEEACQPGRFDVVVTSYEMVIKEKNHWKRFHWRYIIIDEAHRIKNENSILSKVVRTLTTNYRMLITGTPLQNNLHELWALLNFLLPEVFSSAEKFDEWFQIGAGREAEAEVVQQLHKVLRPFLLRRLKSDVEKSLPPKKETILKIGMSDMQRKYYAALLQKDMDAVTGGADRSRLLNIVMQLRKCCNHPYLFQGAEPGPPYITGEHLVENSGKMVLLDKLLPKLQSRGSRVLIFSQMTRVLDILEDYCLYRGYQYCRIDGNTSGEDRESQIDDYNREGSEKFVFLLSTRAGGLGINLYTADIVVLYDSDWNPQMDLQAMDRAHRIGQKKEVQVFRFCVENAIEEKVIEKAYKKLRLDALVIQQGRLVEGTKGVNKDDLLQMVRYGAEMVFSSEAANITDQDIDLIIQKGESSTKELNDKLQNFSDDAMKFTMDGGLSAYDFADEDKEPENTDQLDQLKQLMGANWVDPPERKRKRVVSYAENEFFRQAQGKEARPRGGGPRLPKMPALQDFQFFDTARLTELYDAEQSYELHKHALAQKEAAARAQGASEEVIAKEIAPGEDDPQPLTPEELAEREQLLEDGFSNWNRRDFNAFVRACEKYGRTQLSDIAREVEGKTEAEVREYAATFWSRVGELNDADRILKNIERGEQRIQRQADIMTAIATKLEKYRNPWQEVRIAYGPAKGKAYTEEEDRFLVCKVHELGYGAWDELKAEIRGNWRFRFDWFFKSRTPQELARRTDTLIRLIEKENEEDEERNAASKKGAKSGGAPARKRAGSVTAASSADVKEGGDDGKEEVGSARKATRAAAAVSPAKK